ncbi:MAG TPA: S9 family peptidase [Rhodanobacteraceae bacterium]
MPRNPARLALLVAALAFITALPASADTQTDARIAQILAQRQRVQRIDAVALSYDGRHLAWTVSQGDKTRLELASGDGHDARTIAIPGDCNVEDLRWAPRRNELAVLTRCKVDPSNTKPIRGAIWLLDVEGHASPRKLVALDGFADGMQWSADARRIAFLYVPGATRLPEATASGNPRVGVIGAEDMQVQHVAAVLVSGGAPQVLTPAGLYVYEYRWSPSGDRIAFTAAAPPGDDNWWTAKLYVQQAEAGATPKMIVDPIVATGPLHGLQVALPRWSPDAAQVFFIGGLMSDRGSTGGDLYSVPAEGGAPVDMTEGTHVTPSWFTFLSPRSLLVTQIASGKVEAAEYTLTGPASARQTRTWFSVSGSIGDGRAARAVSLSSDHKRIAFYETSFEQPPEVHAGVLASTPPPAVTSVNADLKPGWGKAESVEWNNEGFHVQGWLLYPVNYDPHRRYPMIVYVHGGPSSATLPNWSNNATAYSTFGYFVLLPNPRGSFGEGERFTQAVRRDMGYGDLRDTLAGVDAVEKRLPVDDQRLGLTGWSYGGFMSMFAPTQTQRFRAAVAGAGISDWQSYYGENQIDKWMIPFFGASLYDDPSAYAKSSAINFIKQAKTPTLIVVGERDEECPAPQSFEHWHALKTLGIPTTLVVYANQGHHIADHEDQEDILRRSLAWFEQYLPAATGSAGSEQVGLR